MSKRKMLVVDDNVFNRQVLNELFDADFDILQAGDGFEAIQLLREHANMIRVVLLDIVMPKMDGLDVLRQMRNDGELKSIPVIVTSSAGDETYRMKAFELGAIDYISTPFNPTLAKLRVKSALATGEYERLKLQNELLSEQSKEETSYRAILEGMNTSVLEFDAEGNILRYDAAIKRELAGNYDGRQLLDIFSQDEVAEGVDIDRLRDLFKRVKSGETVSDYVEMLLRSRDDTHSWYTLRLLKKIDAESQKDAMVMSITNIDSQKREEESTRARLIRALSSAEGINVAKSEFLSKMSHEIRTPLNAIIGFVNMARDSIAQPKLVEEYLSKTEFASKHLLSIVNDVLDMSAIESGRMVINYESYNLRELINSITAMIYPLVHKKNIQFQIVLDSVTKEILMGDVMRISQILLNLLSNATKFTPQNGSVSLTVKQRPVGVNRIVMDFIVKDDGIGMTPEFIDRLGRPFEQENASIARRYGGSGLGLSITKNLIKLMNGAMNIESAEGRGSTFTVSLPVDLVKTQPEKDKLLPFPKVYALVIDRESKAAEHTKACFKNLGYRCDCATSGKAALALCQTNNYNLVIMDWKLPDLDGRSIIEAIRQSVDNSPDIVIMAYDYTEISKEAMEGLHFINKPVFQSSVLDLLLKLYGKYEVKDDTPGSVDFSGKRVLLAEDNSMNLEIAVNVLTKMGFAVIPAVNGEEACEAFETSAPGEYDAILMDVQMPLMDGYEATRHIRASNHAQAKTIPIIAMTADAFAQDVTAALDCGMNGHIAKPIKLESMKKTLAEIILGKAGDNDSINDKQKGNEDED